MNNSETIQKINDAIESGKTFLITTHENPDGDAIGSSLALASYLTELGKDVTIHICDQVPEMFAFLPFADIVLDSIPEKQFDYCLVLDVGEFKRAGKAIGACKTINRFINIDHHLLCEDFGLYNLVDTQACATGALIYRIIKASGHQFTLNVALSIYVAVITDTGSFRYSNSNPEAFTIAGEMINCGVNAWDIAEKLYESQPRGRLELLGLVLATLTVSSCGSVASVTVTLDMYSKTGTGPEMTDGFVNYPRSIKGVEVAILFREVKPGSWKVGFRSKGKVNVSGVAAEFGGGGHHNAAGCVLNGEIDNVRVRIFALLENSP